MDQDFYSVIFLQYDRTLHPTLEAYKAAFESIKHRIPSVKLHYQHLFNSESFLNVLPSMLIGALRSKVLLFVQVSEVGQLQQFHEVWTEALKMEVVSDLHQAVEVVFCLPESTFLGELHPFLEHALYRKYFLLKNAPLGEGAQNALNDTVHQCLMQRGQPFQALQNFTFHEHQITHSQEKAFFLAQLQKTLKQAEVSYRQQMLLLSAADEMIMNAIFDAPSIAPGSPQQRYDQTSRADHFPLAADERVSSGVYIDPRLVILKVSDFCGSLVASSFLQHISSRMKAVYVELERTRENAGIGMASLIRQGLSFQIVVRPQHSTDIYAICHRTPILKEFKAGFQTLFLDEI